MDKQTQIQPDEPLRINVSLTGRTKEKFLLRKEAEMDATNAALAGRLIAKELARDESQKS